MKVVCHVNFHYIVVLAFTKIQCKRKLLIQNLLKMILKDSLPLFCE